ncbi:GNAT family N-acetyltransferase [Chloroflexales bacterium ZM16-3]|nr:GNAT family N-acetyltransferase [Chloroflexales bacterium ZM16-3]
MSTFEGCYGGYIADGPVSPNEAVRIYKHVCSCSAYTFHMLDNPLAPPLPDELTSRFTCVVNEVTYTLKLDEDFDSIFARFSRTQRNSYRKGLKNGVQIRLANSLDDYQAYYTTYRDAVCRWGESESYGYQWSLFEQLYNLSQIYPTNIKLWLMIFNDQIVGGRFVFYWGLQATGWNGTAHRDFLKYDVMPVSDTEIIRDAISQGYTYFDFNTSGLNEGVISYKQRYNPEGIPINVWRFENSILKPIQSVYWQLTARPYKSKSAKQRAPQSNYHGKVLESK